MECCEFASKLPSVCYQICPLGIYSNLMQAYPLSNIAVAILAQAVWVSYCTLSLNIVSILLVLAWSSYRYSLLHLHCQRLTTLALWRKQVLTADICIDLILLQIKWSTETINKKLSPVLACCASQRRQKPSLCGNWGRSNTYTQTIYNDWHVLV